MRGRNWLIVSGVVYDLTPEIAEGLFSCYQNLKSKHGGRRVRRKAVGEALNERLNELRFSLGVDWGELAKMLGISRSMLGFIRRGDKPVSPKLHQRICQLERSAGSQTCTCMEEAVAVWVSNGYSAQVVWRKREAQ